MITRFFFCQSRVNAAIKMGKGRGLKRWKRARHFEHKEQLQMHDPIKFCARINSRNPNHVLMCVVWCSFSFLLVFEGAKSCDDELDHEDSNGDSPPFFRYSSGTLETSIVPAKLILNTFSRGGERENLFHSLLL